MTISTDSGRTKKRLWLYDVLMVGILLMGAYFRLTGINWGDSQNQHPDELFLTSVTYDIQPVHSLSEFFNTATSTLNPHNTGHGYFVYGTLPVFFVRALADLTHHLANLQLLGRYVSALADLATVALLYFLVKRLYGPRVGVLAGLFSACAVMQIQQSHFYTTDNFATFFMLLASFFAVEIMVGEDRPPRREAAEEHPEAQPASSQAENFLSRLVSSRLFWLSLGFGLALGMAVASKLTSAPLAILLPGALAIRYFGKQSRDQNRDAEPASRATFEGFLAKTFIFMLVGALFALLAFRIFQPYAFSGLGLNPKWLANIKEQRADATPDSGLIWNLQWARRTHLYSFVNLTVWGLGLPLGILAWAGFLWMGWRMLKGQWRQHILLWGWTGVYFVWQSLQYNPNMRYQLPIYPLLAMMAAWAVFDWAGPWLAELKRSNWRKIVSLSVGGVVVVLTIAWAYAFSSIYRRPETRVAASRWIYQNVPGPINLQIQTGAGGIYQEPLPFQEGGLIQANAPFQTAFTAQAGGKLNQVMLPYVTNHILQFTISDPTAQSPVGNGFLLVTPAQNGSVDPASQITLFNQPPNLHAQQNYVLQVAPLDPGLQIDLCGPVQVALTAGNSPIDQRITPPSQCIAGANQPYQVQFISSADGAMMHLSFSRVADVNPPTQRTLHLVLSSGQDFAPGQILASASATGSFVPGVDPRGKPATLVLDHSVDLRKGTTYYLRMDTDQAALTLNGAAIANETDYDWNLPFRVDGYDGFNGIYRGDLNLQVYWNDDGNKLARYESYLQQTDYIFIPTAHQYMQTTRIPERYPLTSEYYRQLLGCPENKEIIWCYRVAKPGMFKGNLGFDLVATFDSYPTLGPLVINDQNSEESFTFYDHPKVLIFRKSPHYDPSHVAAILGAVDLSNVVQLTPGQADHYKSLMLPPNQLAVQQAGGTWSQLFNWNAFQNKYPGLGAVLWYLVMFLVGLFAYPIVRAALPGLPDRGYPLARTAGLVIWAWISWFAGSLGISYSKLTIGIALGLIALLGAGLAFRQRDELKEEWRTKKKYFLTVELLFLAFFLLDLLVRLGNPDIWHDPNGGERPMEFAYFNAILKSTTFPPFDPWFSGGYINYYYYGYVIVGTPVKFLGIVPSIAWNLILPTLFACLALAGFSVVWNLIAAERPSNERLPWRSFLGQKAFLAGVIGAAVLVLVGNLATVRLFYRSFMCTAAPAEQLGGLDIHDCIITPGSAIDKVNIFTRTWWTAKGFFQALGGQSLDFTVTNARELYWGATRVLPGDSGGPITEFPLASFFWSDLHAHLMGLAFTVLVIAWTLSVVLAKAKWKSHLDTAVAFILAGLVIGSLKPLNTWDFYTYLLLAGIVLVFVIWRYFDNDRFPIDLPKRIKRLAIALGAAALLAGLSLLFYYPFSHWFGQAYTSFELWRDNRSDISSWLVHWGVFLFFIISWMVWETHEWMAATPVSSLRKLKPYRNLIIGALVVLFGLLILQQVWSVVSVPDSTWKGFTILWLALPLAVWAGVLMLRPGLPDTRKLVLFMVGTGLVITAFVEIFVVKGDVGRQNTVFKFYMQAWVLLGLAAAAAFIWLLDESSKWLVGWRTAWNATAFILFTCSALFLAVYGVAKIHDRMSPDAPHSLDGMVYMAYTKLNEFGAELDLSEDYRAIRWMQQNVKGSPVIAEAPSAGVQYAWLNRFSVYTGLPDVIGWEWHQIQQRLTFTDIVKARGVEEDAFYETTDVNAAREFLRKYNVRYIIVGQLERTKFGPDGLEKFAANNGVFWNEVYHDGQTSIYEVPAGTR